MMEEILQPLIYSELGSHKIKVHPSTYTIMDYGKTRLEKYLLQELMSNVK